VNNLIKLRLFGLLFTQYKTSWLVRIRLCRLVGLRFTVLLSTEFKVTFHVAPRRRSWFLLRNSSI